MPEPSQSADPRPDTGFGEAHGTPEPASRPGSDESASPGETAFQSVQEIRVAHANLTRQFASAGEGKMGEGGQAAIIAFLNRVQQAGLQLTDPDDREMAQSYMDIWTERLIRSAPDAAGALPSYALATRQEDLATEAEQEQVRRQERAAAAARRAQDWIGSVSEETRNRARRLCGRLIQLGAAGAFGGSLTVEENTASVTEIAPILDQLVKLEVLQRANVPPAGTVYTLSHPSLLVQWKWLGKLVAQRRRVREAAELWAARGRQPELLLSDSALLEEMSPLDTLSPLEEEFLHKSREELTAAATRASRVRRRVIGVLVALCAVLAVALVLAVYSWLNEQEQRRFATVSAKEAERQKTKAEANLEKAKINIQALEAARTGGSEQRAELERLRAERDRLADYVAKTSGSLPPDISRLVPQKMEAAAPSDKPDARVVQDIRSLTFTGYDPAKWPVSPGVGLYTEGSQGAQGSVGVFLRQTATGALYLISPKYLVSGPVGAKVYAGRPGQGTPIGQITNLLPTSAANLLDLVAVKIDPGVKVTNAIAALGGVNVVEEHPVPGLKVRLIGAGSGLSQGEVRRVDNKTGAIITSRLSTSGDAGAPVVTAEGARLVGLLIARSGSDESLVQPIGALLARYGFVIYHGEAPADALNLAGLIGEVLVGSEPGSAQKAEKYVTALVQAGITLPVPHALPKKRVPTEVTEVRYYDPHDVPKRDHPDDLTMAARRVQQVLVKAGIPADKIRLSYVEDHDAPINFIQVSLAPSAFVASGEPP